MEEPVEVVDAKITLRSSLSFLHDVKKKLAQPENSKRNELFRATLFESLVVSSLAIDHSGSRLLSGSYDYTVRMYDFQGMNARLESFRQIEPSEGHQVRSLSWSPSADRFLCVTGSAQAKIYDRDGLTLGEFMKGDMYIRDLKNTKGHITGLTCEEWHPKTKETTLMASEDGSLRIWDVNDFKSQKQGWKMADIHRVNVADCNYNSVYVIKPKLTRPGRVPVTSCAWDREGKSIASGIGDGSIQIFATVGDKHHGGTHVLYDPTISARGALVCVARAPRKKSIDDIQAEPVIHNPHALPLFRDQPSRKRQREKMLKDPLKSHKPEAPMNGPGFGGRVGVTKGSLLTQYLLKGWNNGRGPGRVPVTSCAWDREGKSIASGIGDGSIQIFATVGDKHHRGTHVLYDPTISARGALVCVARAPRKKSIDDIQAEPVIHNPHALPLFRDQPSRKRQREKMLKDPLKSHKPEAPMNGPGFGGRVGVTKGSLLTQYLLKVLSFYFHASFHGVSALALWKFYNSWDQVFDDCNGLS
ncbi:WD repeat-containing protein 70 [Tanacetum coccineum]